MARTASGSSPLRWLQARIKTALMADLLARLRTSPALLGMIAAVIAAYVKLAFRTTGWERDRF